MEINEKKLKEILKKQREDYQRYLGVLAENFESQVKLLAESVIGIQEQLVAIRDMIVKNTEDIEMMRIDMAIMKKDTEIMKTALHFIKDDLKEKISRDEFKILEKRVAFLERKLQRA